MGTHKSKGNSNECKMHTTIVVNLVDKLFGIPRDILMSKTRLREVVNARAMCYFILRKHHDYTYSTIGENFDGKDHATILHGINTHNDLYITNFQGYKADFHKLEDAYKLKVAGDNVDDDNIFKMIKKIEEIEENLAIVKRGLIDSYSEGRPVDPVIEEKINQISDSDEKAGNNDERAILEQSIANGIQIGAGG